MHGVHCMQLSSISIGPRAFLSAVGRLKRLWDNRIEVCQDFWCEPKVRHMKQSIRKRYFIRVPQSLSRRPTADKKA